MADVAIKKRVNRLENLMAQLITTVDRVDQQVESTQRNLDQLSTEMREFKDEMRKQWGELSNKFGTMAEDLVAPSIERILRDTVGCSKDNIEYVAVRVKKRHPVTRNRQEFDVVAVCSEYVLINETKSKLGPEVIKEFVDERLTKAREFFPEYADKKIIGAIASLYVDESLVHYGERLGLIVLGFSEDVMDVLNEPEFVPKVF